MNKTTDERRRDTPEWADWVAVAALPRVSPTILKQLWQQWTPKRLLDATDSTLSALGFPPSARKVMMQWQCGTGDLMERVNQVLAWQRQNPLQHHVVSWDSADYPALLKEIPDPPPFLLVYGDPSALNLPQIGIVGSRRATRQGLRNASDFSRSLARHGFVITSGLALGIDGAAHLAAVEAQQPTLAILGCGPDVPYPARHQRLVGQILDAGGALVSEFWPGMPPLAGHFPRRNRIISGLCAGVLVVEAAPRSGSLITARLALDYNREVFALPGALHSPQSQGCHSLIREGATLVQTTDHIIEELGSLLGAQQVLAVEQTEPAAEPDINAEDKALLELMEAEQLSLDQLCILSGRPLPDLLQQLCRLELSGLVEQVGIGYQRIG